MDQGKRGMFIEGEKRSPARSSAEIFHRAGPTPRWTTVVDYVTAVRLRKVLAARLCQQNGSSVSFSLSLSLALTLSKGAEGEQRLTTINSASLNLVCRFLAPDTPTSERLVVLSFLMHCSVRFAAIARAKVEQRGPCIDGWKRCARLALRQSLTSKRTF
jgi:hypothetical protein